MAVKKKFPYRSALVACNGGCHVQEGQSCENGCIGCGICVSVCPFQAIVINENGVAQVDEAKCVACGKCVRECPKQVIHIHECANYIVVRCSNRQNGKEARQVCLASCIGRGYSVRRPAQLVLSSATEHCAVIDESVCLSCMCVVKSASRSSDRFKRNYLLESHSGRQKAQMKRI